MSTPTIPSLPGPSLSGPTGPDSSGTLLEERTEFRLEEGDHERFAHYADKDKITEAMINGTPVRALCGKIWVPSRDPQRFPVCPECKEIYDNDEKLASWK